MKIIVTLFILLASFAVAKDHVQNGIWDGTIDFDQKSIAFPLEITTHGSKATVSFFNGEERVSSTSGSIDGQNLNASFDHYATKLEAKLTATGIEGTYGGSRSRLRHFQAKPHQKHVVSSLNAPDIHGVWELPTDSPKGEKAWRFIVQQSGPQVTAAILRVDGDTGALQGTYDGTRFLLNHFDGARASIVEIVPNNDRTLTVKLEGFHNPAKIFTAVRVDDARAKGLPPPTDASQHTWVKDPNQPLQFSFPDVNGKVVSNADAQFKNKVVIVNITGSWCPNCHDEAPFLADLYRKYHSQGLEIVALDFEEAEQKNDPVRLQAFIKKYGIKYTYLIAGEPKELQAKIPQAENLNSWPTTFFLSRDGRVTAVHAGFAAPASGEFNTQLKKEVTNTVEKLLAANTRATR